MELTLSLERIKQWGLKGGMGILDQALFSGANFLLTVFLARSLNQMDFGAFAVGFAVLSFLMQIYTSYTLEPMAVLGPHYYKDHIQSYLLSQVWLLFLLSTPIGLLLGLLILLGQFLGRYSVISLVLTLSAVSLPLILFPVLMRRAFYVLLKPGLALLGSVVYLFGLVAFFLLAVQLNVLNGATSILLFAAAGFFSGIVLLFVLRKKGSGHKAISLMSVLLETWSFGKWLVISGTLIGIATQSPIYFTGLLSRIEDAGAVRILQTLIQPMMLTSTAFSALATPTITFDFVAGSYRSMQNKILRFTLILGGLALAYEILLVAFGGSLNEILFAGKYSSFTSHIPIWGLVPILLSFFWGGVIALQASRQPQAMLIISGVWSIFSVVPGLLMIPIWGAWGATISIVTGFVAAFIATWFLYWRRVHQIYFSRTGWAE